MVPSTRDVAVRRRWGVSSSIQPARAKVVADGRDRRDAADRARGSADILTGDGAMGFFIILSAFLAYLETMMLLLRRNMMIHGRFAPAVI